MRLVDGEMVEELPGFRDEQVDPAEKAATIKRAQIDNEYAACLSRGVTWGGVNWTATDHGRDTLMELIEVAEASGSAVAILDAVSGKHDLSLTQLQNLKAAGRSYRADARAKRMSLHAEVDTALSSGSSATEIRGIDVSSGWPG